MPTNQAEYMRQYRAKNPNYRQRTRQANKARRRALEATAKAHSSTFAEFHAAFRKEEGLET